MICSEVSVLIFLLSVIYLGVTMALGTASVCLSVLVLNFHHRGSNSRMPRWARVVFLKHCARMLCFQTRRIIHPRVRELSNNFRSDCDSDNHDVMEVQHILSPKERARRNPETFMIKDSMNYHNVDVSHISNKNNRQELVVNGDHQLEDIIKEWQMLARVLDRLFFVVVFLVMLTSACFLLLSPWYVGPNTGFL